MLHLGGGIESLPKEGFYGKKFIESNINCKPSQNENMYPYDEELELVRRHFDDFPIYKIDAKGNPFNPKKQIDGSEFLKPKTILNEYPKQSLVN